MKRRIALVAQLAAVLYLGAFAGTALGDNGKNPLDPPGKSGDAPGQEKKADQPAPQPAAPQPAPAEPQPIASVASEQAKAKAEKAKPNKPVTQAKAEKPAKTERPATSSPATVGTLQSSGHGRSDEAHHHVIICHRTGSDSNPYVVINIPLTAWHGGHTTHPAKNGRSDILLKDPASRPGSKDGFTKDACGAGAGVTRVVVTTTTSTTTTPSTTTSSSTTASSTTTTTATGAAAVGGSSASGGSQPTGGVAGAGAGTAGKPLGGVLGASGQLGRTAIRGQLPFTGLPLWTVALLGLGLVAGGLALRRRSLGTTT